MKPTLVAFDFETTGLSPMGSEIIEIGAVKFDTHGNVLGAFEQLIKPTGGIDPRAQAVNGISEAMVAQCPPLEEVLPQFMMFIGYDYETILIAHNAARFDIKFLAVACARCNVPFPNGRFVDSLELCAACMPKPHNLPSVCRRLGIDTGGSHRALADAKAVMRVTLRLASAYPDVWARLPLYYADDFGIDIISPPPEFEEWEDSCNSMQEVEFVYCGGSNPGEKRLVIPRSFFEYNDEEYMSGFCLKDKMFKTFKLDDIFSITLPESQFKGLMSQAVFEPAAATIRPPERDPGTQEAAATPEAKWWEQVVAVLGLILIGAIVLVPVGVFLYFVDAVGFDGAMVVMIALGGLLLFLVMIYNVVNGFFDSIFGPLK